MAKRMKMNWREKKKKLSRVWFVCKTQKRSGGNDSTDSDGGGGGVGNRLKKS